MELADPGQRDEGATLGAAIRAARLAAGRTQGDVATRLGRKKQLLSSAERDAHLPPIDLLVQLHDDLFQGPEDERAASLGRWVLLWAQAGARRADLPDDSRESLRRALDLLRTAFAPGPRAAAPRGFRSLEDFPDGAFQPLTIITGDRRESSENRLSLADMFAYSAAITDVTFLPLLPAMEPPPKIRTDKLLVVMDDRFVRQEFGSSNLLIIGSPAVNWAARIINRRSLFRFDIEDEWVAWDEDLRRRPELKDEQVIRLFSRIVRRLEEHAPVDDATLLKDLDPDDTPERAKLAEEALAAAKQLVGANTPRDIMDKYRKSGILDPADGLVHGEVTRDNNDFGLISMAPNPFDPTGRHVAILVGGIHGPGTTHALRVLLERPDAFADHPFGGVLEVMLWKSSDWSSRFQRVEWRWRTSPYRARDLAGQFARAEHQPPSQRTASLRRYPEEDVAGCSRFLARLLGTAP